jgi:hypothetical protein
MEGRLITFAREELLAKVSAAREQVWLVSPFLTAPVAKRISDAVIKAEARDLRMLTALVPRSVQAGVLSVAGLSILREADFEIASIPNLHAKLSLVDADWGLLGSGNLTGTGLGGAEGGNVELGVLLGPHQRQAALELVASWWEEKAGRVGAEQIEAFAALPELSWSEMQPPAIGKPLSLSHAQGLQGLLVEDDAIAAGRSYWIKSNYHRSYDAQWWHRGWISDWRRGPYEVGDLVVLYLSARDGGPACCPAVVEVTSPSRHDPEWVLSHRDADAADRWPYVTETAVVGEVPIASGAELSVIGKNGQSVQGGYCRIDRSEFERMIRAMLAQAT